MCEVINPPSKPMAIERRIKRIYRTKQDSLIWRVPPGMQQPDLQ